MSQHILLDSFVGEHTLSGAYFDQITEPAYSGADYALDSQVLRFTLDNLHYEAVEDPNDGYRSSLRCVRHAAIAPALKFAPVLVVGVMQTQSADDFKTKCEILQFLNASTRKIVMEIGTTDTDDYYPGFVALFSPENL